MYLNFAYSKKYLETSNDEDINSKMFFKKNDRNTSKTCKMAKVLLISSKWLKYS